MNKENDSLEEVLNSICNFLEDLLEILKGSDKN